MKDDELEMRYPFDLIIDRGMKAYIEIGLTEYGYELMLDSLLEYWLIRKRKRV